MNIYHIYVYISHTYAVTEENAFCTERNKIESRTKRWNKSCGKIEFEGKILPENTLAFWLYPYIIQGWRINAITFSFDTQFLNATLLTESPARLRWRAFSFSFSLYHTSFCFFFIASEPLSFSGANESTSCTFIPLCMRTLVQSHATSGHETQKVAEKSRCSHPYCLRFFHTQLFIPEGANFSSKKNNRATLISR